MTASVKSGPIMVHMGITLEFMAKLILQVSAPIRHASNEAPRLEHTGMESLAGDGCCSVGELMHNSRNIKEYAGDCISNFFNKYFLFSQMYF